LPGSIVQLKDKASSGHNALKLEVGVAPNGRKYLKTKADQGRPKTLLNQPGFPAPAQPDTTTRAR
jgi:hypothetical protein